MIEYLYRDNPLLHEARPRLYRAAYQVATTSSHCGLADIQGKTCRIFALGTDCSVGMLIQECSRDGFARLSKTRVITTVVWSGY